MMKGLRITTKDIAGFREHLILEERSAATIQKYIRDIKAFAKYAEGPVTRETGRSSVQNQHAEGA